MKTIINGIKFFSRGNEFVNSAIIARIADEVLKFHTETEKDGIGIFWEGPQILPEEIKDISVSRECGVIFTVIHYSGLQKNTSLSTNTVKELIQQGWM